LPFLLAGPAQRRQPSAVQGPGRARLLQVGDVGRAELVEGREVQGADPDTRRSHDFRGKTHKEAWLGPMLLLLKYFPKRYRFIFYSKCFQFDAKIEKKSFSRNTSIFCPKLAKIAENRYNIDTT
jgi:hypothetical protein